MSINILYKNICNHCIIFQEMTEVRDIVFNTTQGGTRDLHHDRSFMLVKNIPHHPANGIPQPIRSNRVGEVSTGPGHRADGVWDEVKG
jgi:hypothetical protein